MTKDVRAARDAFEERIFSRQKEIEDEALRRLPKSPKAAREFLTKYCVGLMEEVPPMFIKLRESLMTKYTNNRE